MKALLYLLFFVSGALALVYEIVWMRALALVCGASAPAIATVLAVFMLGLALGAWWIGKLMSRRERNPWLVYGVLEILVGLFAWAVPPLLRGVQPALAAVYGSPLLGPIRFAAAVLVLLPPTICLGGTLPAAVRAMEARAQRFSRALAWLYGVNTLGAVAGAFVAPFLLLPWLGMRSMLTL